MEKPWGPRLVEVVAGEVRRHRTRRGMSAQGLADACAALGWPIKRTVLSNLESGYRETITVPELFVLAQALEVPPLLLLLPLGEADSVEIRPGVEVSIADALQWFLGERPLPGTRWEDTEHGSPTIALFQAHERYVDRWTTSRYHARLFREGGPFAPDYGEADAEKEDLNADLAARRLRDHRTVMRDRGLTPPALPPELARQVEGVRET